MDRSKRAIRTPKRFDDEAFGSTSKPQPPPKPVVVQPPKPVVPEPPVTPAKNIIKVKLNKVKLRDPVRPPKETIKINCIPQIPKVIEPPKHRLKMQRPRTPPVYADLIPNVVLPFWDARTAAEDHEDDNVKELVHCHCGVSEELGLMVQCETCLTWQHAHCLGIERPEDAPDGYTCRACSDPKFARDSMKWAYDQEWLTKGRMKKFRCDPNPIPDKKVEALNKINTLIGNVLNIHQLIHSLRVKQRLLDNASDEDPELKLFRNQWQASYQHRDGSHFIPTISHPSSTPASTISAIVDTPDPNDITVEAIADVSLPDIAQLDDVSAILDNSYNNFQPIQPISTNPNEVTPNDCRANLKLHIQQTEEYLGMELAQVEEQLNSLEKECSVIKNGRLDTSIDSLKNDLQTMMKYVILTRPYEN